MKNSLEHSSHFWPYPMRATLTWKPQSNLDACAGSLILIFKPKSKPRNESYTKLIVILLDSDSTTQRTKQRIFLNRLEILKCNLSTGKRKEIGRRKGSQRFLDKKVESGRDFALFLHGWNTLLACRLQNLSVVAHGSKCCKWCPETAPLQGPHLGEFEEYLGNTALQFIPSSLPYI